MLVAVAFGVTILLFVLYDFFVTRRQNKTVLTALKTQKIVTSLFPKEIGRRIISQAQEASSPKTVGKTLSKDADLGTNGGDRIAQFYPDATVIFADLAGFTAWSSMREPDAAFTLLESLYNSFDKIASRRRVFKGECISYNTHVVYQFSWMFVNSFLTISATFHRPSTNL